MKKDTRAWVFVALATLLALTGCGKALTPNRARGLVDDYLVKQQVMIPVGDLTSRIGPQYPEKVSVPGIRRLIETGYVEEKAIKVSYPDLSGSYQGVWPDAYMGNQPDQISAQISVNAQSRPPFVILQYSIHNFSFNSNKTGSCRGIEGDDFWMDCTGDWGTRPVRIHVLLNRDNPDVLTGEYTIESAFVKQGPMNLHGSSAHRNIEQEKYSYTWTGKVPSGAIMNGAIKLDHVSMDSCENLLLNGETAASCRLKWHSGLDTFRKGVFGRDQLAGEISASFGKQPDGNWIVTTAQLPSAPYSVMN